MRISTTSILQLFLRLISAILGMVALIYFGNFLGSETLGVYFLILGLVVWFELFTDLGFNSAVVKRLSEQQNQKELYTSAIIIKLSLLALVTGIILINSDRINNYVGQSATFFIILLLFSKTFLLLIDSNIRGHNLVATATIIRFFERALRPIIQVTALLFSLGIAGLIYGYFSSVLIASAIGIYYLQTNLTIPSKSHFLRLFSYAKYSVMGMVRSRTARWTDTVVLGFFVSKSLIGIYEVVWSLVLVLMLANDSLITSIFPKMSELASENKRERVSTLLEEGLVFTSIIALPGAVGALVLGEDLLLLFGSEFTNGVIILYILVFWPVLVSFEQVFRVSLDALDRPDLSFQSNISYVLFNIFGNILLVWQFSWTGAAFATTFAAVVSLLVTLYYSGKLLDIELPKYEWGYQLLSSLMMGVVVYIVDQILNPYNRFLVFISVIAGCITYFSLLLLLSDHISSKARNILRVE